MSITIFLLIFPFVSNHPLNFQSNFFLIDTTIVYPFAVYNQKQPAIGFDGINNLVVWEDYRYGVADIFGTRITNNGVILDPIGIPISIAQNSQCRPALSFDGINYLVVWEDYRSGSEIYGARVATNGTLLDPDGFPITAVIDYQQAPAVAFDGINYFVVWQDKRNGSHFDIFGARISPSGTVIDTQSIAISTASGDQLSPVITFDGVNYLVAWEDWRNDNGNFINDDIYCARVSPAGIVLDTAGIPVCTASSYQHNPHSAFAGNYHIVVWEDYRNGIYSDIYGARIATTGIVLDTNGIIISSAPNYQTAPVATSAGNNYFILWVDQRYFSYPDIYGARIDTSGAVLDTGGIIVSNMANYQYMPAVNFNGLHYITAWCDFHNSNFTDIYGARVSLSGNVLDTTGILITTEANLQEKPAIGFDGFNFFVVWQDWCNDNGERMNADIYGIRVSSSGLIIDAKPIPINTTVYNQVSPQVGFDGVNYFVVWEDWRSSYSSDIYGGRVNPSGIVIDTAGIPISVASRNQQNPAISFDGTNYLVVWDDYRGDCYPDIYAARVTPQGIVLDSSGIPIATGISSQRNPAVVFDGVNYLIVWQQTVSPGHYDIYGRRINTSGVIIDTVAIPISTVFYDQCHPSLAFDGSNYFVVWDDAREFPPPDTDIYGARVTTSGVVLDPSGIPLATSNYRQYSPRIEYNGESYIIFYEEIHELSGYDIYGLKVSSNGVVIDSFKISDQSKNQRSPALKKGYETQIFYVYSGYADSVNNHPVRTQRIWAGYYPPLGIEEKNHKVSDKTITIAPNPFRNHCVIKFQIPNHSEIRNSNSEISLRVYDVAGRLVKSFNHLSANPPYGVANGGIQPFNQVVWDDCDDFGHRLPAGIYFVRLEAGDYRKTEKAVLLR